MSRQARVSGEYLHVIVRGIGKQILFEDSADYNYYISLLRRFRDETKIVILAYCLMENHVHLLLKDSNQVTTLFMKKLGVSYASYYNRKYTRTGHLFQDRYKSENVTDDSYLLSVYRYILRNPEKAGIAPAKDYPWSSYHEYGRPDDTLITETNLLAALIGNDTDFSAFMAEADTTECLEFLPPVHDDAWALAIIKETMNESSGTALQKMPKAQRDKTLATLKNKGISIRQLERLTGINRGVIQKA